MHEEVKLLAKKKTSLHKKKTSLPMRKEVEMLAQHSDARQLGGVGAL